ncbi:MAG TPA: isochorismatase family cysteine hydrolase [Rhizomicrobium sp.]|jgi:nicotinamidase-related amidase
MHAIQIPPWAVERGKSLNHFTAIEPGRTALLNIDMQNVFLAADQIYGNPHARDIVGNVNRLSRAMRAIGAPVIWTRQTHTRDGPFAPPAWQYDLTRPGVVAGVAALQADAAGHALYPAMDVDARDIVVDKYRYGALSCPAGALAAALKSLNAAMVIITGTLTNCCCESTARELNMAGYKVIVVPDATAAVTDAEHNAALLNLRINFADVRPTDDLLAMIAAASP